MARKTGGLGRGLDALFADAAPIFEEEYQEQTKKEKELEAEDTGANDSKKTAVGRSSAGRSAKASTAGDANKTGNTAKASKSSKAGKAGKASSASEDDDKDRVLYIDINDIKPNQAQPRTKFDEVKLGELASSIKENGVIQPLIVRKAQVGYELVAGERRWRASRLAGLKKVPCIVRDFDEKQNAIVAIIENMQREDLDAIEEAMGLQAMSEKYDFTQEQISASLGKSRAYIANSLRLLKLPKEVQEHIKDGDISAGHGRTLITVGDKDTQLALCKKIIKEGLSVRATEKLADKIKDDSKPERKKRKTKSKDNKSQEIIAVEEELRTITGTKVTITGNSSSGKIELDYYSLDELNRLIDALREAF